MTSRRAFKHHEQKLARALQFEPGHVGGRVASAQPVNRLGGTVRGSVVGAAGAVPILTVLPTMYIDGQIGGAYYGLLAHNEQFSGPEFDAFNDLADQSVRLTLAPPTNGWPEAAPFLVRYVVGGTQVITFPGMSSTNRVTPAHTYPPTWEPGGTNGAYEVQYRLDFGDFASGGSTRRALWEAAYEYGPFGTVALA